MFLSICIPSQEQVHADFCVSLVGLTSFLHGHPAADDFRLNIRNERGSLISMQRENLVLAALKEGATHILFLDSDMTFPPDLFHRLLARDKAIVGCNYVKRIVPAMPNTKAFDGKLIATNPDSTGLVQADSTGLGAVLIRTEVFKDVPRPWFDTVWMDDLQMIGEDVFFFRKARHCGHVLWIDHDASQQIGHVGSFTYKNALAQATMKDLNDAELEETLMHKEDAA